jgi:hypothetical protein
LGSQAADEPDETLDALRAALKRLRDEAKPGAGKQPSRAKQAAQLAVEVDDILRRWASELASPEPAEREEPEPPEYRHEEDETKADDESESK